MLSYESFHFSAACKAAPPPREKGERAEFGSSFAAANLSPFSLKIWRLRHQQEHLLILAK